MKKFAVVILLLFLLVNYLTSTIDYSKYRVENINSIRKATKVFQKKFDKKRGTKEAEEDFDKILSLYYDFVYYHQNKMIIKEPPIVNESYFFLAKKMSRKFYKYGLSVKYNGEFYIEQDFDYIYLKFSPYLSEDWQETLKLNAILDNRILSWDTRYSITKTELISIMNLYKEIYKKYPNSSLKKYLEKIIEQYERNLKTYPYMNLYD